MAERQTVEGIEVLQAENARLRAALKRAKVLIPLITVGQVFEYGGDAIEAAGLHPYCLNEGRATGEEPLDAYWIDV